MRRVDFEEALATAMIMSKRLGRETASVACDLTGLRLHDCAIAGRLRFREPRRVSSKVNRSQ
jgi:hypothetical protein